MLILDLGSDVQSSKKLRKISVLSSDEFKQFETFNICVLKPQKDKIFY